MGVAVPILTREEARAFYDRFGSKQDTQEFYEDPATTDLIRHARFEDAYAVFEFGCGTGRFAARLLAHHLPPHCRYLGVDISSTMVRLARQRLSPWCDRAEVHLCDGSTRLDNADSSYDRFVSNYVLDLLSDSDIHSLLNEAHRLLREDGLLCLASLTRGETFLSSFVSWSWQCIHSVRPKILGGCRPIELRKFLPAEKWQVVYRNVVKKFGITSEVLVALALAGLEQKSAKVSG